MDLDGFSRPAAGAQFVFSELRATDVIDVVAGPPLSAADSWWDYHATRNPTRPTAGTAAAPLSPISAPPRAPSRRRHCKLSSRLQSLMLGNDAAAPRCASTG